MTTTQKTEHKHCTMEDIGLGITGEDAKPLVEAVTKYLSDFTAGDKCPQCDATLRGLFGSFSWGIQSGEGQCSCGWPARAHHNITDADGEDVFNRPMELVLAYHPNVVDSKKESL